MSDYKGFRIWTKSYSVMNTSSTGVTIEYENDGVTPTGRLKKDGDFVSYYPNTQTINGKEYAYGVKACLEDVCAPLCDPTVNGVGWSLDTELYARLNSIDGSIPAWELFKTENPHLWTPSDQVDPITGNTYPKSVKLVPCSYVYAMFFKHTSGYKLMVALNYTGMHSYWSTYQSSYYQDAGWLYNHIHYGIRQVNSSTNTSLGGFMVSMIPPANPGGIQDDWHPEYSIRSENWYSPTSFPIVGMFSGNTLYNTTDTSFTYNNASWLRQGTSTNYNAGTNAGMLLGINVKLSLMADTKGNVGFSYLYKASSNTKIMNPTIIIGPLYKKKIYDYDTLPQRYIACIIYSCLTYYSSYSDRKCAWCNHYSNNYYDYSAGTYNNTSYLLCSNINTGDSETYTVYTAYPALDSSVYTNYRYAKALYTTIGLVDEEVLRCSLADGLISGQTFNGGDWCFINNNYTINANNNPNTNTYLYPSIRWDNAFNGPETFC